MHRHQRHMQLFDSERCGTFSKPYIVEGESAARSVATLCDTSAQAVLALPIRQTAQSVSNQASQTSGITPTFEYFKI